jgi:ABC-type dipeptide/oligopeptide/nickel transport system ATPase component
MTTVSSKGAAGPARDTQIAIRDLSISYASARGTVSAVRNVSLTVQAGRTLGIVGESGSGKSTIGLGIMRLLPPSARATGRILLSEDDLLACSDAQLRRIRGRRIGMVFQDSLAALNPVFTVRSQLVGTLLCHRPELGRAAAADRAGTMLEELGIKRQRLDSYPHQFSGGMRQRVMIAAALASDPNFLICDESTSDLDTVSQKQILDLLVEVQRRRQLGLIFISHDLGVIRRVCEEVAVMYRGDLVEFGPTEQVLSAPQHWYTRGLIAVSMKKMKPDGYLETLPSRVGADRQAAP